MFPNPLYVQLLSSDTMEPVFETISTLPDVSLATPALALTTILVSLSLIITAGNPSRLTDSTPNPPPLRSVPVILTKVPSVPIDGEMAVMLPCT